MNLRSALFLTFVLLKIYEADSVTCTFMNSTSAFWGYGCQLRNQVIESESDLVRVDGEHMTGHGDEHVIWISSENSTISFFPSRLIEHFPNVTQVTFDKSLMASFGESIKCDSLIRLGLDDNLLTEIPDGTFANCHQLRTLSLNRNDFGSIGEKTLSGLTRLNSLHLAQCNLSSIHPRAFELLEELAEIQLSSNNLETLDSDLFRNSTSLSGVRIDNNRLSSIPEDIFFNNRNLQHLNLSHNQITTIDGAIFGRGFMFTGSADLSDNIIDELPIFELTSGLTNLIIDRNRIKRILPDTFMGLWSLNRLSLANNQIEDLQPFSFFGLVRLTSLFLNSNNITEFQSNTFNGLSNLLEIRLSDNQLTHLNASSFVSMFRLWTFHAERNRIESVDDGLFDVLLSVQVLDLTGNVCADESFNIYWDFINNRRIIPHMGTCSSSVVPLEMKVLMLAITSIFLYVI